jgi:arginine deiminase
VHTPGQELLAVTPGTREDYLYDDIISLDVARREHQRMVQLLSCFAEVHQVRDLLGEVLRGEDVREFLISRTTDVVPSHALARRLAELPAEQLVSLLIEGAEAEAGPIGRALNQVGFALPPLPNLFFTRDVGIVIGEYAVIGSMRHGVRWTEELLVKALFCYHPTMANAGILYDGSEERRSDFTLEGGDVHPLRPDLLVLGYSDRSSPAALDHLCELVLEHGNVRDVIVVVMPGERSAIHLDMIFTQVDRGVGVFYPPHFVGPERLAVLHRSRNEHSVREMPSFFAALEEVGFPLEPVFCGGRHRPHQEREQWASGCNLLSLRPGVALAYARNELTLAEFSRAGFAIHQADDVISGRARVGDGDRAIITLPAGELVRGGGGPRCMTLPLRRDDL